jgi:hypothetical protein
MRSAKSGSKKEKGSKITLGLGVPPGFFLSPKVNILPMAPHNGFSILFPKKNKIQIPFFPSFFFPL